MAKIRLSGIETSETCPVCGEQASVEHGYGSANGYNDVCVHIWHCPVCGDSVAALFYECPLCVAAQQPVQRTASPPLT